MAHPHPQAEAAVGRLIVIIPTHGRPDLLERTLASISHCCLPPAVQCVRVVENGGQHGAEHCVRRFAGAFPTEYLYFPKGNKSAALNYAMRDLDDEFVVFFDDDVRVAPETLIAYAECLDSKDDKRFFGGPFGCDYDHPPPEWLARFLPVSARGWTSPDGRGFARDLAFIGFNWAAYARHIKAVGGFDPRVGPGGEAGASGQESNMQVRLQAAGFEPRYVADAMVWHYVPESRCSPEWAIRRILRQGVYSGLHTSTPSRIPFGVPPWILRRLLRRTGVFLGSRFSRDPERRFRAHFSLTETWGEIRGMMQRRRTAARPGAERPRP